MIEAIEGMLLVVAGFIFIPLVVLMLICGTIGWYRLLYEQIKEDIDYWRNKQC